MCWDYSDTGSNGGTVIIRNCTNSVNASIGDRSAGIVFQPSKSSGYTEFINCNNYASVGKYGGGMSYYTGYNNGTCKFINCSNSGSINTRGGGICGSNTFGTLTITNCSNSGSINEHAGGIVGPNAKGDVTIKIVVIQVILLIDIQEVL